MNLPGGWELILVAVLIMLLFGYKKLPEATRSLGKSVRIFKAETKGLRDDDAKRDAETTATQAAPATPAAPVAPAALEQPSVAPRVDEAPVAQPQQQPRP